MSPRGARDAAVAALLSVGAALWVLRPALAPGRLVGSWRHPDTLGNHWLLEWASGQLSGWGSLLHNDRYYWPIGDAPLLAGNGMETLPYLPFSWLMGWPESVTAFALFQLSFAGMGAYALARAAGAEAGGGWVAAVTLAAHPFLAAELTMGHFSQVDLGWMAFSLAALLRLLDDPRPRWALLTGALGGVTALLYWYYGLFLGIAAGLLLLTRALRPPNHGSPKDSAPRLPWRSLTLSAFTALLVCGPWLAASLSHLGAVPGVGEAFPSVEATTAVVHPGLPFAAEGAWQQARVLPLALPLLALLSLRLGLRAALPWALIAAFGWTLSLGGAPYEALYGLAEPLRRFWWPYRHGVLMLLGVGVLAARGVSALPAATRPWLGLALAASIPAQLALTGDLRQVKATPLTDPPPAYRALSRLPEGVVLEPPLSPGSAQSQSLLVGQLIHGKPLLTGHALWVDRVRPAEWDTFVADNPSLAALQAWEMGGSGDIPLEGFAALYEAGWRYLVVNRGRFARALPAQARGWHQLGRALGGAPVIEAREVVVYAVEPPPSGSVTLPPVVWPAGLSPAGPRHPLDTPPWPEPLFGELIEARRPGRRGLD